MVVAIDGPAGAGKSTVARAAARALGFTYLDSGAMYRAVALRGGDPATVAREARLELGERVTLDGEDVTEQIREPWVSEAASRVASDPAVREALVDQQRRILTEGDWVAEGRDIGTVVAPGAEVKVFLTADPAERAEELRIELGERVLANGEDVTDAIRAPQVSEAASSVATDPRVREALVRKQRELLSSGDWVAEGRDIGTVVAPGAELKVYLTASPEERARRRAEELGADVETVMRDQALRDAQDMDREHSPLVRAPDAVELDTSGLSVDEVVARVVELVEQR